MKYKNLYRYYEKCFEEHGDSCLGVDWPNASDLKNRFDIMLQVNRDSRAATVLDFGCGNALLYSHLQDINTENIDYVGVDISKKFIDFCKTKHPDVQFHCIDITTHNLEVQFDYAICNGTFTEKLDLTFDEMFEFFSKSISVLFEKARRGIAFNLMSSHVDYERADLFHVPHDLLARYIVENLSRHYVIRNDYGLYEYTVYVYKEVD